MEGQGRKHKNIPIFIPHLGCPHRCTFCDQRTISGHTAFDVSLVKETIEASLATLPPDATAEIAYFGGSFTAIDRTLMRSLLDLAQRYVNAGRVSGIRFSTRPDAVDDEVLDVLDAYSISAVELGLQSMDEEVLALCERGHTVAQAEDACRRVVGRGHTLVGQMMLGLPGSNEQKEERTARLICSLGAKGARVYPTVVLEGTALARSWRRGEYTPLTDEQAAVRAAGVLRILEASGVQVLRVGLCASDMLASSRALAGASHPALGELAYGELFFAKMAEQLLTRNTVGRTAIFAVPHGKLSQAIGQKRKNITRLTERFSLRALRVVEQDIGPSGRVVLCSLD